MLLLLPIAFRNFFVSCEGSKLWENSPDFLRFSSFFNFNRNFSSQEVTVGSQNHHTSRGKLYGDSGEVDGLKIAWNCEILWSETLRGWRKNRRKKCVFGQFPVVPCVLWGRTIINFWFSFAFGILGVTCPRCPCPSFSYVPEATHETETRELQEGT